MAVRYLNATGTQALINEIKSRLANKADVASIQAILAQIAQLSNTIPTKVSQLDNDEGFIDRATADELYATATQLSNISDVVSQNQTAINLLNSDDQTQGSVDYKIAQAMSSEGTPFYDTALPGSIPGWLAQLPAGANLASMYIHPVADSNAFKANRHYFAWTMKATIEGETFWSGIALGLWTGEHSMAQKALYEIEADTNNYVALSNALTGGGSGIPDLGEFTTAETMWAALAALDSSIDLAYAKISLYEAADHSQNTYEGIWHRESERAWLAATCLHGHLAQGSTITNFDITAAACTSDSGFIVHTMTESNNALSLIDCSNSAALTNVPASTYFFGLHDYHSEQSVTTNQGEDTWITELTRMPVICHKTSSRLMDSEIIELPIKSLNQHGAIVGKVWYKFLGVLNGSTWTITDVILQTERSIFNSEIRSLFE